MHKSQTAIDAAREKLLLIFFSYFWRSHRELFFYGWVQRVLIKLVLRSV